MTPTPRGKGIWLWQTWLHSPAAVVRQCVDAGLGHLLVKFADGRQDHAAGQPSYWPKAREIVRQGHAAGLEVWGWAFLYGNDPAGEGGYQGYHARLFGFDGFVLNCETSDGSEKYANNPDLAVEYLRALRAEVGADFPVGLSSYWKPSVHADMPWTAFLAGCDFVSPQVYWRSGGVVGDLELMLNRSLQELAPYGVPIVPTGGDLNESGGVTANELQAFAAAALRAGCPSYNLWEYGEASASHWKSIKSLPSPARPTAERQCARALPERRGAGGEARTMSATSNDVARIAVQAAAAHAKGNSQHTMGNPPQTFDLVTGGWCGRFVRQCHEVAMGLIEGAWPWSAPSAACCQARLAAAGKRVTDPNPGDIMCLNDTVPAHRLNDIAWQRANRSFGHIAIWLGKGQFAENTSSSRGPGTVISAVSQIPGRHPTFYRVLPAKPDAAVPEMKIVLAEGDSATVIDCHPEEQSGVTRADLRPVVQALGWETHYRVTAQGPRVYLKPAEPSPS